MRTVALSIAVSFALVACAKSSAGGTSGVEGTVRMSPTCPVEHMGSPCVKAWVGTVQATDMSGNVVATTQTDTSGAFRLALDPGTYLVRAETSGQTMPRGIPVQVTIRSGSFAHVVLQVDTGIR